MQAELALIHKGVSLEPALAHAIKLAEGGVTLADKRVGYLFVQEHMRSNHPAALLLVNTIRKDLESGNDARVALALSALIHLPNEDVIPAVQIPLKDLYRHHSSAIQRLALAAAASLGKLDISVLEDVLSIAPNLIQGDDAMVLSSLIDVLNVAVECSSFNNLPIVANLVLQMWNTRTNDNPTAAATLVLKLVQTTGSVLSHPDPPERENLDAYIHHVMADYTTRVDVRSKVLVLQFCRHANLSLTEEVQAMILKPIRAVLAEYHPSSNDLYWVLTCLELLPVQFWSNTLDEAEVKVLVKALNEEDESTRRAALRLFKKADRQILKVHFESLCESTQSERAMEAAGILEENGDGYARRVRQILTRREKTDRRQNRKKGESAQPAKVSEEVVSMVLTALRDRDDSYRSAFTGAILNSIQNHTPGPTLVLIATAISCEYVDEVQMKPEKIAEILCTCLPHATGSLSPSLRDNPLTGILAAIQEAVLIAILRVCANCDVIPATIIETVENIKPSAGRHIQRRCEQFAALCQDRSTLLRLAKSPSSRTLPGFMAQVESHFLPARSLPPSPPQLPSSPGATSRKLRYTPYDSPDRPPLDPFLRSGSNSSARSRSRTPETTEHNPLDRTVTPGELALMMQDANLRSASRSPALVTRKDAQSVSTPSTSYRSDLIALDSPERPNSGMEPFDSESSVSDTVLPEVPASTEAFDELWRQVGVAKEHVMRGWCGDTPQAIVEQLRSKGFDLVSWSNDTSAIRVFLRSEHAYAVLLCREGDDSSCLWILKSLYPVLRTTIRDALQDSG
ncbi:ARM repeat-containing protein [Dacryopinax primogenitus]|uniref:ARM repeat-containing protein n=1 Tax=Dacryopinax primogenitus (strain DJM 731) TaxID=1858805 RepID=M5GE95_DACPD|nr:ARM repeat-containing protein [Dacryopinax primogenitus]EJU05187.1 ARM repeat-containing protein [Dacryopinax primogenitus]